MKNITSGYFLGSQLSLLTRFFNTDENETSHEAQFPEIIKMHCDQSPYARKLQLAKLYLIGSVTREIINAFLLETVLVITT